MIVFSDIHALNEELRSEIQKAIDRVLDSGRYVLGDEVESFEREWAAYCGAKYAVSVGSGLDALTLSLLASGVGIGDEVIVPGNTFIATWLAVSACGAIPVPVDPIESTYNIDSDGIEERISNKTKAIIPVHLYGQPADLEPVLKIAAKHDLRVIEDAAQAHGAVYNGRKIGGRGDAVAWSFYPGKNLGALGDGGCITTNNETLSRELKLLRNYGSEQKYLHIKKGVNSRLDPIHAAVLRAKLKYLDLWNASRQHRAGEYKDAFSAYFPDIEDYADQLFIPNNKHSGTSVWHLYVLSVSGRDRLREFLGGAGIETLIHYPLPPFLQGAYKECQSWAEKCPKSVKMSRRVISLPMHPRLKTGEIERVVEQIRNFYRDNASNYG
jgi:dTDP-4-amino-4,6-dideoxygalactose transaminase